MTDWVTRWIVDLDELDRVVAHPQPHAVGELVDGDPIPSVHGGGRPELGLRVTG